MEYTLILGFIASFLSVISAMLYFMEIQRRDNNQLADANLDDKDDILEQYLAETIDLRNEPAIIVEPDGVRPTYRTLDGTQVFPLRELAEMIGYNVEDLKTLLETERIMGIRIGNVWFARKEVASELIAKAGELNVWAGE